MKLLLWRDPTTDTCSLDSIKQVRRKPLESLARYAEHVVQLCEENGMMQRIERSWQIKWGQNGHLAFISTTEKAVHDIWESCLRTVMGTVSRLEVITETVGQQMMQHNLLQQFGEKLQVWHRSAVFESVCVKASCCCCFSFQKRGHYCLLELQKERT